MNCGGIMSIAGIRYDRGDERADQGGRRRLVVNADDFGFSAGVTDGIVRSFKEGVLTSTTLIATMPDRERAVDLAGGLRGGAGRRGWGWGYIFV